VRIVNAEPVGDNAITVYFNDLQGAWTGIEQISQEVGHIGSQGALDI